MEYLDVLDEQGNPTGKKKLRDDVHREGDWHACVQLWLVNSKSQILLQKRSKNVKTWPGRWAFTVGGHVLAGEKLEDALVREMFEELGLEMSKTEFKFAFKNKNPSQTTNNNQWDSIYVALKDVDVDKLELDPEEVEAMTWVELGDFKKAILSDDDKFVPRSADYLSRLFIAINNI